MSSTLKKGTEQELDEKKNMACASFLVHLDSEKTFHSQQFYELRKYIFTL